jgi:hypothetical protein
MRVTQAGPALNISWIAGRLYKLKTKFFTMPKLDIVINTVKSWIETSKTPEQLDCLELFIQDTLYMRYGADEELTDLRMLILNKRIFIGA